MKNKNQGYFAAVIVVTLAIAATHQNQFPRFLLGFEILLGILLLAKARYLGKKTILRLTLPEIFGKKNSDLEAVVQLENGSILPIPEIRVCISCRDSYTGREELLWGTAMLDTKGKARLCFHLTSMYCGVIEVKLKKAEICDYLGIFSGKCRLSDTALELSVLPEGKEEVGGASFLARQFLAEGEESSVGHHGMELSDVYDIRDFRPGDALHRIHWKMTAKMDELLVRDHEEQTEKAALLLFDLCCYEKEVTREDWDAFLELCAAMSLCFLKTGGLHYTAWLQKDQAEVIRMRVSSREEWQMMLAALVREKVQDTGEIAAYYKERFTNETLSEVIRITLTGEVIREQTDGYGY